MSDYGWIRTFTGRKVTPLNIDPETICIEDIAHALSLINRFTGHTRFPYSVAQHSLIILEHLPQGLPVAWYKWALLHDAIEAYLGDTASPIKKDKGYRLIGRIDPLLYTPAKTLEERLMGKIADAFGLFPRCVPTLIDTLDKRLFLDEYAQLLPGNEEYCLAEERLEYSPLGYTIHCHDWETIKSRYLMQWNKLVIK